MIKGRPRKNEKKLIQVRNQLIVETLERKLVESQSEAAFVFRLPRNTVSTIAKKHYENKGVSSK